MAFPKVDDLIPAAAVILQNPDWDQRNSDLKFWKDAFHGTGGFAADTKPYTTGDMPVTDADWEALWTKTPSFGDTYLQPFHRERAGFLFRLRRAHYENLIKPAVMILLGFLLRRKPTRTGYDIMPETQAWLNAVTVKGLAWDAWMKTELGPVLAWAGEVIAVFDRRDSGAQSLAEQQAAEDKGRLIARVIDPTTLQDWSVDENNQYRWLKTKERIDLTEDPLATVHKLYDRYTWYTQKGWYCVDVPVSTGSADSSAPTQYKVSRAVEWPAELTRAPIAVWRIGEEGRSLIQDAAPAARAHYNMHSLLSSMLYESGFNVMVGPPLTKNKKKSKSQAVTIGSGNYVSELYRDGESGRGVRFESPDSGPAEIVMKVLEILGESVNKMVGLGIMDDSSTTGPAKRFAFANLNAYLGSIVGDFAEGEHEAMKIAAEMHLEGDKYNEEVRAQYATNFEPVDIEALLKALDGLKTAGAPPQVMAEGLKEAVTQILQNATQEQLDKLGKFIDDAAVMSGLACLGDGPDADEEDEETADAAAAEPGGKEPGKKDDGTAIPKTPEI